LLVFGFPQDLKQFLPLWRGKFNLPTPSRKSAFAQTLYKRNEILQKYGKKQKA